MSKARTINRVVCIDPNLNESGYRGVYPYQFDKLTLYIDLSVYVPNRDGSKDIFDEPVLRVSFMGGTQNTKDGHKYLTTNYTDINYQDPLSNTHECLGIESATIAYTSWMVPTVTIKFVDVRGASLFGPQEYAHVNETNGSLFFKALFSFPSPLFRLNVKGYLGKPAVYDLKISKFDGQLNSETGNFEATVDFVGYMYGIYADMPLSYLALAPYTKKGGSYWKSSNFRYSDSTEMKTLSKFSSAVHSAEQNNSARTILPTQNTQVLNTNINKIDHLGSLLEKWENIIPQIFASVDDVRKGLSKINWDFYEIKDNGEIYYALPRTQEWLFGDKAKYDEGAKIFKEFCSFVDTFNISFSERLTGYDNKGEYVNKLTLSQIQDEVSIDKEGNFDKIIERIKEVGKGKLDCNPIYFYRGLTGTFKTQVLNEINRLEKENTKLRQSIQEEAQRAIQRSLGFTYTVPNIYSMFFAHMDTFAHLMNTCISNIRSNPRTLAGLNWSITNTDLKNSFTGPIPPFTLFLREGNTANGNGNKTVIWPGDIPGGDDLEEVKLVNELIDAIEPCLSDRERGDINFLNEIPEIDNITYFPVLPSDWLQLDRNPYSYITNARENLVNKTLSTFGLRFIVSYFFNRGSYGDGLSNKTSENSTNSSLDFGTIEAHNFYKANPSLSKEEILAFYEQTKKEDCLLDFLTSTDETNDLYRLGGSLYSKSAPVLQKTGTGSNEYEYTWGKEAMSSSDYMYWLPVSPSNPTKLPTTYDIDTCCELVALNSWDYSKKFYPEVQNCVLYEDDDEKLRNVNNVIDIASSTCKIEAESYSRLSLQGNLINEKGHILLSTDKPSITKLLEINKHIKSFSGQPIGKASDVKEATLRFIFGMEVYYLQTDRTNISDKEEEIDALILLRKAYCFIVSTMASYNIYESGSTRPVYKRNFSYGNYLAKGAHAWRSFYMKEHDGKDPIVGKGEITSKDICGYYLENWYNEDGAAETVILMNLFLKWAESEFFKIMNTYELKDGEISITSPEGFYNFIKKKSNNSSKIIINQLGYLGSKYTITSGITLLNGETNPELVDISIEELDKGYFDSDNNAEVKACVEKLFTTPLMISSVGPGYSRKNIDRNSICNAFTQFREKLKELYKVDSNTIIASVNNDTNSTKRDLQISTYLTLKNLYENWFAGNPNTKKWKLSDEHSQFNKFKYVDTYLRDISNTVLSNAQDVARIIDGEIPGSAINNVNQDWISKSLYSTLADIAQRAGMILMAFPTFNSWVKCNDNKDILKGLENRFSNLFTPQLTNDDLDEDGSSYLCIWQGQASDHLDISNDKCEFNNYENNGFDLFVPGTYDIDKKNQIPAITDVGDGNFMIPFFIVDYGNQNQGIFKHISIGMSNPQTTEASLKAQFAIASTAGSRGGNENGLAGQDLYSVYSNYSYTCTVEALGNVQILPMMYFQLIHIPMFHGVYQIINVEHTIQSGEMVTKFVGVRVNKHEIPYARGLQPVVTTFGSSQYVVSDETSWIINDNEEVSPIYHFYNDGKEHEDGSDAKHDIQTACDPGDQGENWKEWLMEINETPVDENYFAFGASVRNRMNFYKLEFKHIREDEKGNVVCPRCARAVREYVECCTHKLVMSWNGYTGQTALEAAGYERITTNDGAFVTSNDESLDLTSPIDREVFTNNWALNGDICLQMPEYGSEYGHACMFVDGYPNNGKKWVSDYMQSNMWVYNAGPKKDPSGTVGIQVWRHKSRKLGRLLCTDKFEEYLETAPPTGTTATREGPWVVASVLIPYINKKIDDWARDKGVVITEEDKCARMRCIVAGMLGTFNLETNQRWDPTIGAGISTAIGLAQWTEASGRRDKPLKEFFNVSGATLINLHVCKPGEVPDGTDIGDLTLETQAKYVTYELDTVPTYKKMLNNMLETTVVTPTKMGEMFVETYEAPFTDELYEQGKVKSNYCPREQRLPRYLAYDRYYYNHGNSDPSGNNKEDNWWNCVAKE